MRCFPVLSCVVLTLAISNVSYVSATIEDSLGNASPELTVAGFVDNTLVTVPEIAQVQQAIPSPAPFDIGYGSDNLDFIVPLNFDQMWQHDLGGPITDPILSATLTFGIADHDSAASGDQEIEGLNTQSFFGVGSNGPLDVDYRLDETGDIFPETASLQADELPVEFDFGSTPLSAGETSRWMFVGDPNNDLWVFGDWGAHLLASDPTGTPFSIPFDSYLNFIPSPASLTLLVSGLIGFLWARPHRSYRDRHV